MADHSLDARGMTCPLPVLRARKALKALDRGHELVESREDDQGVFHYLIRKG